jgi:hypothetical protein
MNTAETAISKILSSRERVGFKRRGKRQRKEERKNRPPLQFFARVLSRGILPAEI